MSQLEDYAYEALQVWKDLDTEFNQEYLAQQARELEEPELRIDYPEPGLVTVRRPGQEPVQRPMTKEEVDTWKATLEE